MRGHPGLIKEGCVLISVGWARGALVLACGGPTKLHKGVSPKVMMIHNFRELGRESSHARRGIIRLVK